MSGFGGGPWGSGPWGGGVSDLYLVREFFARNSNPNEISLTWKKPLGLSSDQEIVIVRRKDAFPMELYNDDPLFSSKVNVSGFTDVVQVEIFRGSLIRGSNGVGTTGKLTDALASFPTSPSLKGRILRDSYSRNYRISSNTSTEIFIEGTEVPANGQYVVLIDFPNSNESAITGTSTSVGAGFLRDTSQNFELESLKDRILVDQAGNRFVIINNTLDYISVSGTPSAGDYTILQEFADFVSPSDTVKGQFSYVDTYLNSSEASSRTGTGLEDSQFYYYTAFTHKTGENVAQSVFSTFGTADSTQSAALSTFDREFQEILLRYWPNVFKLGDQTGDFEDLMAVFGFGFNEIYGFVHTFNLTNPDRMYHTVLSSFTEQLGISVRQVGIDTNRRIIRDLLPTLKQKGSKEGIVDFIRIITTWDVTNGTKDAGSIIDDAPNLNSLRLYSDTLGSNNTRLFGFQRAFGNDPFISYTYTSGTGIMQWSSTVDLSDVEIGDFFIDGAGSFFDVLGVDNSSNNITIDTGQTVNTSSGGDIYKKTALADVGTFFDTLPGIIIPGFFTFREFVVEAQDIALFVGESTNIEIFEDSTRLTDSGANFGGTNNLLGNFLIPKQGQVNDIFEIISNTSTTITVTGVVRDSDPVGDYAILSPLNTARFRLILSLMTNFAPSNSRMGIQFT